jgi:hypothetical protein
LGLYFLSSGFNRSSNFSIKESSRSISANFAILCRINSKLCDFPKSAAGTFLNALKNDAKIAILAGVEVTGLNSLPSLFAKSIAG